MRILEAHWVMALATHDPQHPAPYPTPLFYALAGDPAPPRLLFASSPRSAHGRMLERAAPRAAAAAAVYLESETVGELRGVQLRGRVGITQAPEDLEAYLARHPVASEVLAAGRHALYAFIVEWAKLTDNRLGFGAHPVVEFPAAPLGGAGADVKE